MNLLTVKKHCGMQDSYQPFRTQWISDEDGVMLTEYFKHNKSIEGLYQYSLTKEGATESVVFYALTTDLLEYVRYRFKYSKPATDETISQTTLNQ